MVQSNQIPHADDSALADLVGEAKTADEALDFETQERRIESVKLAIQGYERMPQTDLISAAAAIEAYILHGYTPPGGTEDQPKPVGSRAFVEDETGAYKEV